MNRRKTITLVDFIAAFMMLAICVNLVLRMFDQSLVKSISIIIIYMLLNHLFSIEIKKINLGDIDYRKWSLQQNFVSEVTFMTLMTLAICALTQTFSRIADVNLDKAILLSIILQIISLLVLKIIKHRSSYKNEQEI